MRINVSLEIFIQKARLGNLPGQYSRAQRISNGKIAINNALPIYHETFTSFERVLYPIYT